jgi:hypothetical protein
VGPAGVIQCGWKLPQFDDFPSEKNFHLYKKRWKITIFHGNINYKWPFSIAMLTYQTVLVGGIPTPLKNMKVSWYHYSQL